MFITKKHTCTICVSETKEKALQLQNKILRQEFMKSGGTMKNPAQVKSLAAEDYAENEVKNNGEQKKYMKCILMPNMAKPESNRIQKAAEHDKICIQNRKYIHHATCILLFL